MASRTATKTGVWSDTTVWDGGTLPQVADDVDSNGFTVTIDQDVEVISLTSTGAAGGFNVTSAPRNIIANIISDTRIVLTLTHLSGTVTITGTLTGGTTTSKYAVSCNTLGDLVVNGNVNGGIGNSAYGIVTGGGGHLVVTGDVIGGSGPGAKGISCADNSNFIVNGDVRNGPYTNSCGIGASANLAVTGIINGRAIAHNTIASSYAVDIDNNAGVVVIDEVVGGTLSSAYALYGRNLARIQVKKITYGQTGLHPIYGLAAIYEEPENNSIKIYNAAGELVTFVHNAADVDYPLESDVRAGVSYSFDVKEGTAFIPEAASVAYGVPIDNTVGTAVLTIAEVQAQIAALILAIESIEPGGGGSLDLEQLITAMRHANSWPV